MAAVVPDTGSPSRAGRKPRTESQIAEVRARIVAAAAVAFAEHGSHELHVAAVLDAAGISRATFYRFFPNVAEPLELVIAGVFEDLMKRVERAIRSSDAIEAKVVASIDAYLEWGGHNRALLRVIQAEKYDRTSPVHAHHRRTMDRLLRLTAKQLTAALGRPVDQFALDVLLNTVEYAGTSLYLSTVADDAAIASVRSLLVDMSLAAIREPATGTRKAKSRTAKV